MIHWLIDFFVIAGACTLVEVLFRVIDNRVNRNVYEMLCDGCKKPRKLLHTRDKKLWLCRACSRVYKQTQEV